jgi:hypothetical protein
MYRVPANIVKQIIGNQNQSGFMSSGSPSVSSTPASRGFGNYQPFIGTQPSNTLFGGFGDAEATAPPTYTDTEIANATPMTASDREALSIVGNILGTASMVGGPIVSGAVNTGLSLAKGDYGKAGITAGKTAAGQFIPGAAPFLGLYSLVDTLAQALTGKSLTGRFTDSLNGDSDIGSPVAIEAAGEAGSMAGQRANDWITGGIAPNNNTIGNVNEDPASMGLNGSNNIVNTPTGSLAFGSGGEPGTYLGGWNEFGTYGGTENDAFAGGSPDNSGGSGYK